MKKCNKDIADGPKKIIIIRKPNIAKIIAKQLNDKIVLVITCLLKYIAPRKKTDWKIK